jgi:hypothetical protein
MHVLLIVTLRSPTICQQSAALFLCGSHNIQLFYPYLALNVDLYRTNGAGYLSRYSDWLRTGRSGDRIPVGGEIFRNFQSGPEAHPASCTMGTRSFQGVKRPGRGADHPPPCSTEAKKEYSYTSTHPLGYCRPVTGWLYLYLFTVR